MMTNILTCRYFCGLISSGCGNEHSSLIKINFHVSSCEKRNEIQPPSRAQWLIRDGSSGGFLQSDLEPEGQTNGSCGSK